MHKYLLAIVIILSGCTTKALWEPEYTTEYAEGFYYNKERKELLVSSATNGYIFDIDQKFGEALILSRSILFKPKFDDFALDRENSITGTVSLILYDKNISEKDLGRLKSLGFKTKNTHRLEIAREIKGKRYQIDGKLPFEILEKPLAIKIAAPDSYTQVAGKIIVSPATITIDAAGYIVAAPIIAFMMVITEVAGP